MTVGKRVLCVFAFPMPLKIKLEFSCNCCSSYKGLFQKALSLNKKKRQEVGFALFLLYKHG